MTQVVVTGLGAVSACGIGVEALWNSSRDGITGVRETLFPSMSNQRVKNAAPIPAQDLATVVEQADSRFQDPVAQIALCAARESVGMAGLQAEDFGLRCGVVIGSGFGGATTLETNLTQYGKDPTVRFDGMAVPKVMANAAATWIAKEFGAMGPSLCISTACSSGSQSIGLGGQLIRSGLVDRCIVGGAELSILPGVFRAWELMRVMSPALCRPFSKDRNGMVLGDGAGTIVLESKSAALARGAEPIAELAGYGTTNDAADLLRPSPNGIAACFEQAFGERGISPKEIGYVNAHGTGTVANDVAEVTALRTVFGDHFDSLFISSTKPIHGHALGATGALESIVSIMALREQIAPPTLNFTTVDPKIGIDPVGNTAMPFSARASMSTSLAFGGINSTLIWSLPDSAS